MRMLYSLSLAALVCMGGFASHAMAQEADNPISSEKPFSKVGVGMGNFLNIPIGARAIGMGGGFAGVADDNTALYWNPAGIMQNKGTSASYGYMSLFAGITHNYAAATFPLSESYKGGISVITYGTDDIEMTTMFKQDGTGATYRASDLALALTLAGQLTDQFSFGITGKLVNLNIASLNASGVAFDAGTLYRPGLWGLKVGFAVQNLSAPFRYSGSNLVRAGGFNTTTGNQNPDVEIQGLSGSLPLTFRAGLSSDALLEGKDDHKLVVASEFSTSSDRSEFLSLGAEYTWNDLISARVGYQFGTQDAFGISGGIGVRYQTGSFLGEIDYAIRPHKTLGLVNAITASVRFD